MKLFATAPEGTISLLESELSALGASQLDVRPRGIAFDADLETAYRICLNSRIANRILMPVTRFKASSPEAIYEEIKAILSPPKPKMASLIEMIQEAQKSKDENAKD